MENNKKEFLEGGACRRPRHVYGRCCGTWNYECCRCRPWNQSGKVVNAQEEKKLNKLKKLIDENYLYTDDLKEEDLENGLYSGYINALGDPYSVYYDEEQTKSLQESTSGEYSGIGVVFHRIRKLR